MGARRLANQGKQSRCHESVSHFQQLEHEAQVSCAYTGAAPETRNFTLSPYTFRHSGRTVPAEQIASIREHNVYQLRNLEPAVRRGAWRSMVELKQASRLRPNLVELEDSRTTTLRLPYLLGDPSRHLSHGSVLTFTDGPFVNAFINARGVAAAAHAALRFHLPCRQLDALDQPFLRDALCTWLQCGWRLDSPNWRQLDAHQPFRCQPYW